MWKIIPTCLLLSCIASLMAAEQQDHSLLELPVPVKDTIQREATGFAIRSISSDIRDGRTIYHVRIAQTGIDKRMTIAADGTIIKVHDFSAANKVIAQGKESWDNTKEAAKEAWEAGKETSKEAWEATKDAAKNSLEATKDTVQQAIDSFQSKELTLNQVPKLPRDTIEQVAAGNRVGSITVNTTDDGTFYHAQITKADGSQQNIIVNEDGALITK